MLQYELILANDRCTIAYCDNNKIEPPSIEGAYSLSFDEDFIINKTLDICEPHKSNTYFVLVTTGDIRIGSIFNANSISQLAERVYSMLSKKNIHVIFACKLQDKYNGMHANDSFTSIPPIEPGVIGPIDKDILLVRSIRRYIILLEGLSDGEYPINGHEIIDHEGGLQMWYPEGGIKGHKRKLVEEGYRFIDEYKVEREE